MELSFQKIVPKNVKGPFILELYIVFPSLAIPENKKTHLSKWTKPHAVQTKYIAFHGGFLRSLGIVCHFSFAANKLGFGNLLQHCNNNFQRLHSCWINKCKICALSLSRFVTGVVLKVADSSLARFALKKTADCSITLPWSQDLMSSLHKTEFHIFCKPSNAKHSRELTILSFMLYWCFNVTNSCVKSRKIFRVEDR